jgi:tetratricopeptide (TPR) repeat protein
MHRKCLTDEHPAVADALVIRANVIRRMGKMAEAEVLAREALEISKRVCGPRDPITARALLVLSQAIGHQGRAHESELVHREILSIRKGLWGDEHPAVAESKLNLAQALRGQEKYEESESLNREALATFRKVVGESHAMTISALINLLEVLGYQKKEEAENVTNEIFDLRKKLPDDRRLSHDEHLLAVSIRTGRKADAERLARVQIAELKELSGSMTTDASEHIARLERMMARLADGLYREGNLRESEALYRAILSSRKVRLPETQGDVLQVAGSLARALCDQAWEALGYSPSRPLAFSKPAVSGRIEAHRLATEAEDLLRKVLEGTASSTAWRSIERRSRLGDAIAAEVFSRVEPIGKAQSARLAEAEELLLKTHEYLRQLNPPQEVYLRDSLTRLIRFHMLTERQDLVARWRKELDDVEETNSSEDAGAEVSN